MSAGTTILNRRIAGALASLIMATAPAVAYAAPADKPVAGQQVRFPNGTWSALPQTGPDGKVRQCVLVALRQRVGNAGPVAAAPVLSPRSRTTCCRQSRFSTTRPKS